MTDRQHSRTQRLVRVGIVLLGLVAGLWVAFEHVGFYPSINHCPTSEFVCSSPNIRNVTPAGVASVVAMGVILPLEFAVRRFGGGTRV